MSHTQLKHYTSEEVYRIIRRALTLQRADAITHQELIETAQELGIDPHTLEFAIAQEQEQSKTEAVRTTWLKRRQAGFRRHLWVYLIVNGTLFLINVLTPGPWWFQWPLLGWGIGLAFQGKGAYFPTEREVEQAISRERRRAR